ncbi:hypothetical protein OH773_06330 [Buttiauxella sp. WJP83]|uniref:Uncharacterized protein n=1 Tax=Buttiauxella selenatireducens TaxID=3073902 RepID=A0ABY9SFP5_9ENTR|nr:MULTISPECIES: hypothetical protein [unclassified Buttiauxella]WBM71858.1 hypothetical protein OH773_06330 [Buttiauxella sp. WJP83]WMY75660.1 hypothetical protein RHD99_06855 [Buttiauxella sp. R73]GDX04781.1 hypothetical protein BSPA111_09550 [Buttiauxella sp. A111]
MAIFGDRHGFTSTSHIKNKIFVQNNNSKLHGSKYFVFNYRNQVSCAGLDGRRWETAGCQFFAQFVIAEKSRNIPKTLEYLFAMPKKHFWHDVNHKCQAHHALR